MTSALVVDLMRLAWVTLDSMCRRTSTSIGPKAAGSRSSTTFGFSNSYGWTRRRRALVEDHQSKLAASPSSPAISSSTTCSSASQHAPPTSLSSSSNLTRAQPCHPPNSRSSRKRSASSFAFSRLASTREIARRRTSPSTILFSTRTDSGPKNNTPGPLYSLPLHLLPPPPSSPPQIHPRHVSREARGSRQHLPHLISINLDRSVWDSASIEHFDDSVLRSEADARIAAVISSLTSLKLLNLGWVPLEAHVELRESAKAALAMGVELDYEVCAMEEEWSTEQVAISGRVGGTVLHELAEKKRYCTKTARPPRTPMQRGWSEKKGPPSAGKPSNLTWDWAPIPLESVTATMHL